MKLYEIIKNIDSYNLEDTIYTEEPWSIDSTSLVINEEKYDEQGNFSKAYFLEVF